MSADNTVIVLQTKAKTGPGGEYRVAHVQASENMTWGADYPSQDNPVFNRKWVLAVFADRRVFTGLIAAMDEALRLEKEIGYVEYGVVFADHPTVSFPATDKKRAKRRFFRELVRRRTARAELLTY